MLNREALELNYNDKVLTISDCGFGNTYISPHGVYCVRGVYWAPNGRLLVRITSNVPGAMVDVYPEEIYRYPVSFTIDEDTVGTATTTLDLPPKRICDCAHALVHDAFCLYKNWNVINYK